ncbi:TPA: type 1 fimbrial protein [Serratia marcescens]|nr:type 1 fimbrial protein [Serratia marcescens]
MNRKIKRALQGVLFCLGGGVFSAQATDGAIRTKAKFIQFTCDLSADSKNMIVPLGNINRNQLLKKGDTSSPVAFKIKAIDCSKIIDGDLVRVNVSLRLAGTAPPEDWQLFALDESSTATGVAVGINQGTHVNGEPSYISPNGILSFSDYSKEKPEVEFRLSARYVALSDKVTPGTANLTTQVDLYYY